MVIIQNRYSGASGYLQLSSRAVEDLIISLLATPSYLRALLRKGTKTVDHFTPTVILCFLDGKFAIRVLN